MSNLEKKDEKIKEIINLTNGNDFEIENTLIVDGVNVKKINGAVMTLENDRKISTTFLSNLDLDSLDMLIEDIESNTLLSEE